MEQPGDSLTPEFMNCLICNEIGDISALQMLETEDGSVTYTWRTSCINGHHRDHFWYHTAAVCADPYEAFGCDDDEDVA